MSIVSTSPRFGDAAGLLVVRQLQKMNLPGVTAHETVQNHFLMSRELEQLIDLASAFELAFSPNRQRLAGLTSAAIPDFGTFPGDAT